MTYSYMYHTDKAKIHAKYHFKECTHIHTYMIHENHKHTQIHTFFFLRQGLKSWAGLKLKKINLAPPTLTLVLGFRVLITRPHREKLIYV